MNSLLISNPYLSRPSPYNSSVEEEELKRAFLSYQERQFEEAWAASLELNSSHSTTESSGNLDLFPTNPKISSPTSTISSPTVSSTAKFLEGTDILDLEDILASDPMDHWHSMSLVGGEGDLEKQLYTFESYDSGYSDSKPENNITDIDLFNVPEFGSEFIDESFETVMSSLLEVSDEGKANNPLSIFKTAENKEEKLSTSTAFSGSSGLADSTSTTSLTLNYLQAQQKCIEESTLSYQAQTPAASSSVNSVAISTTSRRKTALGKRVIAQSPAYTEDSVSMQDMEQDLKPDVAVLALGINNGQRRRSTNRDKSVESPHAAETSSRSSSQGKRLRKYELPDNDDPTVKNAKAAKMNRDRKKREMTELKEANAKMKSEFDQLSAQFQREREARLQAEMTLAQEREKNELSAGLSTKCSNLKDVLEGVVEGLNQKFRKTFTVEIDETFATIPAAVLESGGIVAGYAMGNTSNGDDLESTVERFDILAPEYQMGAEDSILTRNHELSTEDNFIPFEVDPQNAVVRIFSNKSSSRKFADILRRIREINRNEHGQKSATTPVEQIRFGNDDEDTVMYDEEQNGFIKDHSETLACTNLLLD